MAGAFLSGIIEGFYGVPWTLEQRLRLLDQLEANGLNTYFYAPKDDLYHRALWRDPYPKDRLRMLRDLCQACHQRQLLFCYGIAPGLDMRYASPGESRALQEKLAPLLDAGVDAIALLFDDIPEGLSANDAAVFPSFGHAHVKVSNDLWRWMRRGWPEVRLMVCPTPYCEAMSGLLEDCAYLKEFGRELEPEIDCFWTGPDIISERIPSGSIDDLIQVIGRRPIIWDNLHANDYDMRRLFLGPLSGRAPDLRERLSGLLMNPNCEFEANHNVVVTMGRWVRDGTAYDPEKAYAAAVRAWLPAWETHGEAITEEELRFFTDCYYLPHQLGDKASAWLKAMGPKNSDVMDKGGSLAVSFARKVTALKNRELMHGFYRHAWELKEAALLLETAGRQGTPCNPWEFRHPIMRHGILSLVEERLPMARRGTYQWRQDEAGVELPGQGEVCRDPTTRIRLASMADEEALYQVCLETGDEGKDGTELYDDPRIIGIIYATPYLHLAPELAYVLEDELGVSGYVLGALDTEVFYRRYEAEWLPKWREVYTAPSGESSSWSPTEEMIGKLYEPETFFPEEARAFPSHMHIDLLERSQGAGHGTRMVMHLLDALVDLGSPGVHLGVGLANRRAIRFYRKIGFRELTRRGDCLYMGLPFR